MASYALHNKSAEEVFIASVTVRSSFLRRLKGIVWLQTLEREFYRIEEHPPRNILDELAVHVLLADSTEQIPTPSPAAPTPPNPISEDDFPLISSQSSVSPTCCPSTKRPYSVIEPVPATPSVLRRGRFKKPRLILKTSSAWATRPAGAAC